MDPLQTEPASLQVLEVVGNAIVGGVERHVQLLVEGLMAKGFRVRALCPFEGGFADGLRARGCPVQIAMLEQSLEWRSLLAAAEIIRRQQVDLVHSHLFNATLLGSVAGALAGVPVVATIHGNTISAEEAAVARLTGTHLITVCTAAYMMGLSLGLSDDQISLIPNAVNTQDYRPEIDGAAFRERLGVPEAARLVGMVARLSREKGPDLFVQAAAAVAAARPDVHFALVGEGPMRAELERQIAGLNLDERFHLAGPLADTSGVYPALDIVCLPSRMEGIPLTLLEAMASARPVVATSVGGIAELVRMGETGWLVAQGDMRAMSEQVLWLLDRPKQACEMGQAGRRRVEESFDIRGQTTAIAGLFQRLVESRRPQALTPLRLGRVYGHARVS
ncbi:MAG TPA: glycosyltransferase [Anaerolineae bacterium]|nr:glycosyltransferase [Anaerolineae bacterium]HPL27572.1 glycosyltransferase [Anaerolineae bacterium]